MKNLKKQTMLAVCLVAALSLLMLGCGGGGGGPEDTIKNFFSALAKGDMKAVEGYVTGKAKATMPKADSKHMSSLKAMGAAFKSVKDLKVDGDKATATAVMDGKMLASAMMEAGKARLARIKDPTTRAKSEAMMKAFIDKMAEKMSKLPMHLVKKDGKWYITKVK